VVLIYHKKLEPCKTILNSKNACSSKSVQIQKLEIKKLTEEKKDALAAQYAAEATLRRLHADQKEDDFVPLESVITPLEAEIKMYRNEVLNTNNEIPPRSELCKMRILTFILYSDCITSRR